MHLSSTEVVFSYLATDVTDDADDERRRVRSR